MELKKIITSLFEKRDQIEQLANFQKEAFYQPYLGHKITICDTIIDIAQSYGFHTIVTKDYSSVDSNYKTRWSGGNNDNKITARVNHYDGNSFKDISIKINSGFDIKKDSKIYNDYNKFHQQTCNITGLVESISYGILDNEHTLYLKLDNCSVQLSKENWLTEEYLALPKETEAYKKEKERLRLIQEEKKRRKELYERNLKRNNRKKDLIIVAVLAIIAFLIFRACT